MIIAVGLPTISSQILALRMALKTGPILAVGSPIEDTDRKLHPGNQAHIALFRGSHVMDPFRWGTLDGDTKGEVLFVQGEGKQYGYRGVIPAQYFETELLTDAGCQCIRVSKQDGLLNLAVVWRPKGSNWPAAFAFMLCKAGPVIDTLNRYQPVMLEDHQCLDFLNPEKTVAVLQKAGKNENLVVELIGTADPLKLAVTDPFANYSADPRFTDMGEYKSPQGEVVT
jgi:hypothetical protein